MKPVLSIAEATACLTAPGAPFEMEETDIRGVPMRVWKAAPRTLRDILERSRAFGERPHIVYQDERLSYGAHYRAVAALAHALRDAHGVAKGDRVAIAMRNFPEWPIAFWAATCIGAIAVPLNAWWTGDELTYGITDSGARVLIADEERLQRLAPFADALPLDTVIAVRAEGTPPMGAAHWHDIVSPDIVASTSEAPSLPDVAIDPEDGATIFYTSGTTGQPKGALGTHRGICNNVLNAPFAVARTDLRHGRTPKPAAPDVAKMLNTAQKISLLTVPLFHVTGCHSTLLVNVLAGSKMVFMYKWDAELALELIARERISTLSGVPSMAWQVAESPAFAEADISSVESVGYGGAPAAPDLVRRLGQAFPKAQPRNGYGLTESSSQISMNVGEDYQAKPDSIGLPAATYDIKIVGDDGTEGPNGSLGELWIRGPNIVKGYWNKPEATAETFVDGWLRTGDIVRRDDDGFLYVVDRAKDMVIRGGENVYCVEVEDALYSHPAVMDAAVIGLPHRILGEEVGAVVQVTPGATITDEALAAHVGERLAAFKVPVRFDLRDAPLPRNANGKILKQQLKDELGV